MASASTSANNRIVAERMRASWLAVFGGVAVFAGKFSAYSLTGSTAVFADALESTVNIVGAGMLVIVIRLAARPPDRDHPYGHGKVEFFSAGLEGAAITVAALLILAESLRELIQGPEIRQLDQGLLLLAFCTLVNAALAVHLIRTGRRTESIAIIADGRHLLTDVWTSVGVVAGLLVVRWTGWLWADPLIAMAIALNIVREGERLVRDGIDGLMDRADIPVLETAVERLANAREPSWIDIHGLRSWRSGARRHFDLHLDVPRFYDVEQLHAIHDAVEAALVADLAGGGDVVVHFDPCNPSLCPACALSPCEIRETPFRERPPCDRRHLTRTDAEATSNGTGTREALEHPSPR
jgi:cation diffusion facilitator family transporter